MKIHYMGVREPLKKILEDKAAELYDYPLQIIDLGGSIKYERDSFINSFDLDAETIILSNRRYNLNDELGYVETELLQKYKKSILYRTSPLDIGIELYRGWAAATGILLTAFSPIGVNWISTQDVASACLISKKEVNVRAGKAFDLTGAEVISMERLKDIFEQDLAMQIDLQCKNKEEAISMLMQNNMPLDLIEWLVDYQIQSSDDRLEPSTNILEQIIGHPPNAAQLFEHKQIN
ncbi:hypothetical protein DALLNEIH_03593 [Bacillus sp. B01(2024)]|uniref:hypothetical protein n=1 Tax=Bacillus siamensis TaxID=659243 RepID=UPI0039E14FAC